MVCRHTCVSHMHYGTKSLVVLLFMTAVVSAGAWFGRRNADKQQNANQNMSSMTRTALTWRGSAPLTWFRLDDGVMGGRSMTETTSGAIKGESASAALHFTGTIDTDGGGFCSLRAALPENWHVAQDNNNNSNRSVVGIRLRYRGDGKTYKFLLSDGVRGRSVATRPTWQVDLPTTTANQSSWHERDIYFSELVPAFGGGPRNQPTSEEKAACKFNAAEMREMGFMLSLRLANGSNNPVETFGQGVFSFSLHIQSVEAIFANTEQQDSKDL